MLIEPKLLLDMYDGPRLSHKNEEFVISKIRNMVEFNTNNPTDDYCFWCCILYFLISVIYLKEEPVNGEDLLHKIELQGGRFDIYADSPDNYSFDDNLFMLNASANFLMDHRPYFLFVFTKDDPDKKKIEKIFDKDFFNNGGIL